mgnify:CR=1 FL=1
MKKILFFLVMFFMFCLGDANAQAAKKKVNSTERKRPCFVDENNNNTCDNYECKSCKRANNVKNESLKSSNSCDGTGRSLKQKSDGKIKKVLLAENKKNRQ